MIQLLKAGGGHSQVVDLTGDEDGEEEEEEGAVRVWGEGRGRAGAGPGGVGGCAPPPALPRGAGADWVCLRCTLHNRAWSLCFEACGQEQLWMLAYGRGRRGRGACGVRYIDDFCVIFLDSKQHISA